MKKLKMLIKVGAVLLVLGVGAGAGVYLSACTSMGASAEGKRLERMQASPQWVKVDEKFNNKRATEQAPMSEMLSAWMTGGSAYAVPDPPPQPLVRKKADYAEPPASGLRVTWLGHSTLLVEIDGKRVLVDPVWGERASPFSWVGPSRWYAPPLPFEELPEIDAVIISHDHYDHLDYPTVERMLEHKVPWLVPLGVGAHLEYWGMDPELVVELDWWQEHKVGDVTFTATPARHFSGRAMFPSSGGGGPTLWAGWSMAGPEHRVYYSGDTALFDELVDIGDKLGPFDLTMIENGAYNALWKDVHLGPEQAVRAHELVKGRVMLPVHWGLFDLALHGWTEPIERVLAEGDKRGVTVLSLQPGQMVEPSSPPPRKKWWPDIPWQTAEEAPVISSGTEFLMER